MPHVRKDRVKETTTTTGAGALALAGAVSGFQSFAAAIGVGNTCDYAIVGPGGFWETGIGTLSASGTLQRTSVYESSNAGALVDLPAGVKEVFVSLPGLALSALFDAVAGKLDKAGGTVTGALRLEPLTLAANNGAADFSARSIYNMSMSAAMTLAVANLADGQSGQVFLTYTGGALSFSGVDRWAVSDAEVATAFTATAVGAAGLVANASYEFIFTRSGGITQGRGGRRS